MLFTDGVKNRALNMLEAKKIELEDSIPGGLAGAELYRIKILCDNTSNSGYYILKLLDYNKVDEIDIDVFERENDNAQIIYRNANDEFKKHLLPPAVTLKDGDVGMIIFSQANKSLRYSSEYHNYKIHERASYIETISFDLLASWNTNMNEVSGYSDFFTSLLSERLDTNGRFISRAKEILKDPKQTAVSIEGKLYPNPCYYIKNSSFNYVEEADTFVKGKIHGDLHGRNIICAPQIDDYALIDYSHYKTDAFLFYDQAYLEVDSYFYMAKERSLEYWCKTFSSLIGIPMFKDAKQTDRENHETEGEFILRDAVCNGIRRWMEDYRQGMGDDVELQFAFARVAAGIKQFCMKNVNGVHEFQKLYAYIAICLERLFDIVEYDWNKQDVTGLKNASDPVLPPEGPRTSQGFNQTIIENRINEIQRKYGQCSSLYSYTKKNYVDVQNGKLAQQASENLSETEVDALMAKILLAFAKSEIDFGNKSNFICHCLCEAILLLKKDKLSSKDQIAECLLLKEKFFRLTRRNVLADMTYFQLLMILALCLLGNFI